MKKGSVLSAIILMAVLFVQCNNTATPVTEPQTAAVKQNYGGFESQVKWGEHIVTVSGCQDCHSPKKMTATGPVIDSSVMLAGHIAGTPEPVVNRKEMQDKHLTVTTDLTEWVGAWGVSYTANLTSDETGIGNWKEEQFFTALREGKYKGLKESRNLLPPMPWDMYRYFTDDEIKAVFAFLKSTKPVRNVVPPPIPPAAK